MTPPADSRPPGDDDIIGRGFRSSLRALLVLGVVVALGWYALERTGEPETPELGSTPSHPVRPAGAPDVEPPALPFVDVTRASGISFVHENGAAGARLLPETMGGGVAFFDYDNDGDPDLLFVNSDHWPEAAHTGPPPTMALYANDGRGRFEDVTRASGLDVSFYGMGPAIGDYDGDGWKDVFFTAVGRNRLFRNQQGRFVEVTEAAGVAGDAAAWSTAAAFFDADRDGDLDLFVVNYVEWSRAIDFEVDYRLTGIGRAYGPPANFAGSNSYLYRNDGAEGFRNVSEEAGIHVENPATGAPLGKGLAVSPIDLDRDGLLDLLVANDTTQNFVFHNQGDGRFREIGAITGLAFDRDGRATGAMGMDAAFYRNDGAVGVAIGNFANEMTSLYVGRDANLRFIDEAIIDGVGPASRLRLTFGVFFFDADLDGHLELLQANGHVEDEINRVQASQQFAQPPQLFWNCGGACEVTFVPQPSARLGDLSEPLVGRGASYADIDADGDLDVVLTQPGGAPRLLRNDQSLGHRWLRIALIGTGGNPGAIGAVVEVENGDQLQRRRVMPTRSYLSQVELPLTFGLGPQGAARAVRVIWPDGSEQEVRQPESDRVLVIRREAPPAATSRTSR